MNIRKTVMADLEAVMEIYAKARQYMSDHGNPNQWINGYPTIEQVTGDISEENSYVCIDDDNEIIGVFRFSLGVDPTYINIYKGSWLNEAPYGVVHRIASANHKKGVASFCLSWCLDQCNNVRIDTHRDNYVMQNLLIKNGYTHCGIIYLEDGDERIAFHRTMI